MVNAVKATGRSADTLSTTGTMIVKGRRAQCPSGMGT
jgi:hypothetical protein